MFYRSMWKKGFLGVSLILLLICLAGCQSTAVKSPADASVASTVKVQVIKGERYSSKDQVAAYIREFRTLPPNYITKTEAQKVGWDSAKGNLWQVTDRKSIGGDHYGNREGLLPKASGRQYFECDIDYLGGHRGAKRIVYSNDGLVFYTDDHYKTYKQLY